MTIRRLRGAADLVTDAIEAAATEAQRAHEAFARRPYAVLERIEPIAGPVKAIEGVHNLVMETAYGSVRVANAIVGAVVTTAIDRMETGMFHPRDRNTLSKVADPAPNPRCARRTS
jgi:hypothetical protein